MERRRYRFRFDARDMILEHRDVLSPFGIGTGVGQLAFKPPIVRPQNFHHQIVGSLAVRLTKSAATAVRINGAFQAFVQNYLGIPVANQGTTNSSSATGSTVPVGTIPSPPTLDNFIAQLDQQVAIALSTFVPTTNRIQPSVRNGPRTAPRAQQALIPFAQAQIAQLGQTLAANPPTFDSSGNLTSLAPYNAVNKAFSAIMNSVAEYSIHPNLFVSASDFYINPAARFSIPFTSTPANAAPDYYLRGSHGVLLPGTNGHLRRFPTH